MSSMCGRYTLIQNDRIIEVIPNVTVKVDLADFGARYNIAPTQDVLAVTNRETPTLEPLHWGLVPRWARDPKIGNQMINARAETLAEKPAFKTPLARRRCLVFADGFYEWLRQGEGKSAVKTPHYITVDTGIFAFAGLWDLWKDPDGNWLPSCTIITTAPNSLMARIHNRMPVILPPEHYADWLTPDIRDPQSLLPLLQPYPAERMAARPVSRTVNSPANDSPACIAPVAEA